MRGTMSSWPGCVSMETTGWEEFSPAGDVSGEGRGGGRHNKV